MTERALTQHDPDDACVGVHCYSHGVDEDGPGYLGCIECGHLYRTRAALWWAYLRSTWAFRRTHARPWGEPLRILVPLMARAVVMRASRITFCPHCLHDF